MDELEIKVEVKMSNIAGSEYKTFSITESDIKELAIRKCEDAYCVQTYPEMEAGGISVSFAV